MKNGLQSCYILITIIFVHFGMLDAQEVKTSKSESWKLSGRAQLQHLFTSDIENDADRTNNGFRIRRGRLKIDAKLTEFISTMFQVEIRDNSPSLKDALLNFRLFEKFKLKAGQFKVPVWREELRSSGNLLLVERSAVASFLEENLLSSWHIGLEFRGEIKQKVQFALNYSNGSGVGVREDAGRNKSYFVNNGKLFTGRINVPLSKVVEVGASGALNQLGMENSVMDRTGNAYTIAPDFGIYAPQGFDIEGGFVFGKFSKDIMDLEQDRQFTLFDVTGRWKTKLSKPNVQLAGLDAWEIAAGISFIEPNDQIEDDETLFIRFGPAVYFGKNTRLQINGEIESPQVNDADSIFKIRTQITVNF